MTGAHRSLSATSASTVAGKDTLVDAALHASEDALLEFGHERELLVLPADAWHVSIQEHEGEVLRLLLAELVEAPDCVANVLQRIGARGAGQPPGAKQAESFFREGEKDGVLRWKVAVDRPGTVFDLGGDVADRDLRVPVRDEEPEGGVENGAAGLFVGLLPTLAPPEAAGGQASHDGGSN